MDGLLNRPAGLKNSIAEFFRETFRRHSRAEYSELMTRGMRSGGKNRKYPWAYVRLFTLLFVLFAVFLLIVRFTSNELFVPTITLFAATCFNLSFLLFLFELYPEKDLSFMAVCLALLLGGALANVAAQILFSLFVPANSWLHAVYTGVFEELTKAGATVLVIVAARKNSPLAGFLFGAAVGCGFSIAEDMGYIFLEANNMTVFNLTTLIDISVSRGVSAVCTHTLWTAAIGWAYCHFSRHFLNLAVYLVTALSCGLHICWDLPLNPLALGFVCAGCVAVACAECILIVHFERRKAFASVAVNSADEGGEIDDGEPPFNKRSPLYWRHWGHFTLTLGAFLMAIVAVIYCSITFSEKYSIKNFYEAQSFVDFMQNGMEINIADRPYDYHAPNDSETKEDNVLVKAVQCVAEGNITYNYEYTVSYDKVSGKDYYFPASVWITVESEAGVNAYFKEEVYYDGKLFAAFFPVNGDVTGYNFQSDGTLSVFVFNAGFERDLTEWRYLSLFITFATLGGVASVCCISLLIKSWRVKKQCLTENASFAE